MNLFKAGTVLTRVVEGEQRLYYLHKTESDFRKVITCLFMKGKILDDRDAYHYPAEKTFAECSFNLAQTIAFPEGLHFFKANWMAGTIQMPPVTAALYDYCQGRPFFMPGKLAADLRASDGVIADANVTLKREIKASHKCKCDFYEMLRYGCKCGGI